MSSHKHEPLLLSSSAAHGPGSAWRVASFCLGLTSVVLASLLCLQSLRHHPSPDNNMGAFHSTSGVDVVEPSKTHARKYSPGSGPALGAGGGAAAASPQPRHGTSYASSHHGHDDEDAALDVWILAGQSNTVGSNGGDQQELPLVALPIPGKILAFNVESEWVDATPK